MSLPERAYVAALNSIRGFGCKTVCKIINCVGSAKKAWTAEEGHLRSLGLPEKVIQRLLSGRQEVDAEKLFDKVLTQGIKLVTVFDAEYPGQLKSIANPPAVLYVKGTLPACCFLSVAIVGTRTATVYGTKTARTIASELASRSICIVSGMARGIDTSAHKGAIDVHGPTVAVLGCGVDVIYPPENGVLAEQIQEHGALISEYPLGTAPDKGNFPARNRIISGLSNAVVVVEAPMKSGALITADFALDQGKEVFAVPGPISSRSSQGCNQLIKEGAKLVQGVEDILEELWGVSTMEQVEQREGGQIDQHRGEEEYDKKTREILNLLSGGPVCPEELFLQCGMSPAEMNILITKLEVNGLVVKSGGRILALKS